MYFHFKHKCKRKYSNIGHRNGNYFWNCTVLPIMLQKYSDVFRNWWHVNIFQKGGCSSSVLLVLPAPVHNRLQICVYMGEDAFFCAPSSCYSPPNCTPTPIWHTIYFITHIPSLSTVVLVPPSHCTPNVMGHSVKDATQHWKFELCRVSTKWQCVVRGRIMHSLLPFTGY